MGDFQMIILNNISKATVNNGLEQGAQTSYTMWRLLMCDIVH